MNKFSGLYLLMCLLASFTLWDGIYSIEVRDVEGKKVNLGDYRGKKMLFITLPLMEQDSIIMNELSQFQLKHADSLAVIGILSNELGYNEAKKNQLKKMYKTDRKSGIILTEGMDVKKKSSQSALLQWLTTKDKNKHFSNEVRGVGYKFFVDETGKLYATIGPEIPLSNPIFSRILNKPVER